MNTQNNANGQRARARQSWGSRFGMFVFGLGIIIFLGCFTIPAFWEHLLELSPQWPTLVMIGACAGEFGLLGYLLWHSFSKSLDVRQMSLIFGAVLALVLLVHGAALWGLKDGRARYAAESADLDKRLKPMVSEQ